MERLYTFTSGDVVVVLPQLPPDESAFLLGNTSYDESTIMRIQAEGMFILIRNYQTYIDTDVINY